MNTPTPAITSRLPDDREVSSPQPALLSQHGFDQFVELRLGQAVIGFIDVLPHPDLLLQGRVSRLGQHRPLVG